MTTDERKKFDKTEGRKTYKMSKWQINIALWAYGIEPESPETYTIDQLRQICKKWNDDKYQTERERRERQLPLL